jgi:hypothetical protein
MRRSRNPLCIKKQPACCPPCLPRSDPERFESTPRQSSPTFMRSKPVRRFQGPTDLSLSSDIPGTDETRSYLHDALATGSGQRLVLGGNPSHRLTNYLPLVCLHARTHFPLHRGPLPPPLTPSSSFRVPPTSFTRTYPEPKTSTGVVPVADCEVGE